MFGLLPHSSDGSDPSIPDAFPLDLHALLLPHPQASFLFRMEDEFLVVDRSLTSRQGSVVLAVIQAEFWAGKLEVRDTQTFLLPLKNPQKQIPLNPEGDEIWGVITARIQRIPH